MNLLTNLAKLQHKFFCTTSRMQNVKEMAYKGLVHPVLEYASLVWDPFSTTVQDEVEKVQNCAASFVTGNLSSETESMTSILEQLKWESQKERRKQSSLYWFIKVKKWEGLLKTLTSTRNQSTENVVTNITNLSNSSTEETKPKRTADIIDQPRPRFYGFTDWKMYKDYNKRMCVKEHYATRMRLNALRKNTILPKEIRDMAHRELEELPRNSSPIRIRNRCVMTSRPRGIQRKWRVSRIMWRHFAEYNLLSGVKRATW